MSETQNWVAMGYIKGAFGVKGWVKVQANTEYADSLLDYPVWRLVNKNNHNQDMIFAEVESGKIAGDELQIKFTHIQDRDQAALLRGYTIEIAREDFEPTEEDEYYWTDLVGAQVINRDNVVLGEVVNLMQTGAHDVLVIRGEYGEKLIPFVSHFIDQVDIQNQQHNKKIWVDWGLDY